MEGSLIEEINKQQNIIGLVVANNHGLCVTQKGQGSAEAAGFITEIVNQASKLDPNGKSPVISLDYGDK